MMPPGIDQPFHMDAEFPCVWPEIPDTAAPQTHHSLRRLHMAVDIYRLIHIELPVMSPAQRVQNVMRVLGAKTGEQHALFVRMPIAIGVLVKKKFGTVRHVNATVARQHTRGNEKAFRKYCR